MYCLLHAIAYLLNVLFNNTEKSVFLITSLPLMNGLACREQLAVFDVINYDIIKAVNYLPMYVLMVKLRPTGTKSKIKADLAYTR